MINIIIFLCLIFYIKIYWVLVFVIIFILYLSLIVQYARDKFHCCVGMQSEGYFQAEIRKIVNKQFMNMYSALLRSPVTVFPKGIITGVLDQ